MVFSGIPFIFFFLSISLLLYYIVPMKAKNYILLAVSLVFYAWGEPVYIILMIFSTLVSYLGGIMLQKYPNCKKLYMICSVAVNLLLLGFFKYANLLISTFCTLTGAEIAALDLTLPIGISFYTFQTMSYNIDVYRGEVPPEKNFFTLMTYVSMFPQLIAGPIVRYETVRGELKCRQITFDGFADGMIIFLNGLFKKVLLANIIGELFNEITSVSPAEHSLLTLWLGIIAFYFHIYFDFGGYSDMAIGMGKMLGFTFPKNFNYPMAAKSISDFWRRWHMSLTTWFRDYVYIPLGGSRCGTAKNIRNILIVWALTGIWHGASWNFAVWGLYFGVLLILEKFMFGKFLSRLPAVFGHIYTTFFVTIGWAIFALEDFGIMSEYIRRMFINNNIADGEFLFYAVPYIPILLVAVCFAVPIYPKLRAAFSKFENKPAKAAVSILAVAAYCSLFVISTAFLVGDAYNPFLYFRF